MFYALNKHYRMPPGGIPAGYIKMMMSRMITAAFKALILPRTLLSGLHPFSLRKCGYC